MSEPDYPDASPEGPQKAEVDLEFLTDIASQCRFMAAILKDIQSQLARMERTLKQEPEGAYERQEQRLHQGLQQTQRAPKE